jgi:hypothetical protein
MRQLLVFYCNSDGSAGATDKNKVEGKARER